MKRTPIKIIERGDFRRKDGKLIPVPKSIRNPSLRRLCYLNYHFIFREDTPDLLNEPSKSIKFIMKEFGFCTRTAYDYYNALVHIHYFPSTLKNEMNNIKNRVMKSVIKDGMDITKIFEYG